MGIEKTSEGSSRIGRALAISVFVVAGVTGCLDGYACDWEANAAEARCLNEGELAEFRCKDRADQVRHECRKKFGL